MTRPAALATLLTLLAIPLIPGREQGYLGDAQHLVDLEQRAQEIPPGKRAGR